MFNKPTVFIIGAGASAECGLPTGADLKDRISQGSRFRFDFGRQIAGSPELLYALQRKFKEDRDRVNQFTKAGNELSETISTFPSIDEALHWWKSRPEIVELGKVAIARYILDAERKCPLSAEKTGRPDVDNANGTWLQPFLSIALAARDRENVISAFNNVTLINFNYDRTIEQYLYWALQQRAGVGADIARQTIESLRIIRPYGSVGNLGWQANPSVPFGSSNHESYFSIATNIRTFTEQINEPALVDAIDKVLSLAHVVVLLGFGFHQQNLAMLRPVNGGARANVQSVVATVYQIDPRNHPAIEDQLWNSLGLCVKPLLAPIKSSQLLTDLRLSLTMAAA